MTARSAPAALLALFMITAAASPAAAQKPKATAAKPTAKPTAKPKPSPPRIIPPPETDPRARQVVVALTDAMGGQRTWDNLPYFRFDFVVVQDGKEVSRFKHWWDKKLGRCRVEGPDEKGRHVTAIFNLSDKKGKTFTDGVLDTNPRRIAEIITDSYGRWVNDTYWIIMPFKLRDPGTRLKYARTDAGESGETYDVLELSFGPGVGLTPNDRYWIYVNRNTHLVDKWEYVLSSQKPPPQGSTWESSTSVGPLQLSLTRRFKGKPVMIRFENVSVPATMDEEVFSYSSLRG